MQLTILTEMQLKVYLDRFFTPKESKKIGLFLRIGANLQIKHKLGLNCN